MLAMCLQTAFFYRLGQKVHRTAKQLGRRAAPARLAGGVHPSSRIKFRGKVNVAVRPVGEIRGETIALTPALLLGSAAVPQANSARDLKSSSPLQKHEPTQEPSAQHLAKAGRSQFPMLF